MALRPDSLGMFWQDEPKVRAPKAEKVVRTPPERTWEKPDYLPELDKALAFEPEYYSDYELGQAALRKEKLIFDTEIYPNYVLFAFRGMDSGKAVVFEQTDTQEFHLAKLTYVLKNFCIVNFNGIKFDFIIVALALAGKSCEELWVATDMLIQQEMPGHSVLGYFKAPKLFPIDQIDLLELTPLAPGLKVCAGRLHAKKMQDLPFVPGSRLSYEQQRITFMYCFNDLDNTQLLFENLKEQIKVREDTGHKYHLDLRSHSDPQMAEAIIGSELRRITGRRKIGKVQLPKGTVYKFQAAPFLKYQSALMQHVLHTVTTADFYVHPDYGNIMIPKQMLEPIRIADGIYQMGIGGLHSQEENAAHEAGDDYIICDTDATSYYPTLIVNAGIVPQNLGKDFMDVYKSILTQRIAAKRAGDAVVAECLKIVVNGTFGKLGSMHSIMYAPNLMMQVTITGQLSLLMLIERFELNGIRVLSANTDGIVTKFHKSQEELFYQIVRQWEKDTGFGTEEVRYKAIYSRDVNNYIAVYEKPQKGKRFKTKGVYAETSSKKNAVTEICTAAAMAYIENGTPVGETIRACRDVAKFTTMRRATGGAVKDGVYLGKIIRWYYSTEEQGEIIYAKNGNKVARTDGAKPCMELPSEFPADMDFAWYEAEATRVLEEIGFLQPATKPAKR